MKDITWHTCDVRRRYKRPQHASLQVILLCTKLQILRCIVNGSDTTTKNTKLWKLQIADLLWSSLMYCMSSVLFIINLINNNYVWLDVKRFSTRILIRWYREDYSIVQNSHRSYTYLSTIRYKSNNSQKVICTFVK